MERVGSATCRRALAGLLAGLALAALAACDSPAEPPAESGELASAAAGAAVGTVTVELDKRPFQLHVPRSYDPANPAPLVVVLHGFRASAALQETYFKLTAESDRRGFLYAMPDGTPDREGRRFWNATDACCDFYRTEPDDSGYLRRLIDTVKRSYQVDASRVYIFGHSNGGFMAYRMACEHADQITAVVSLAGAATAQPSQCRPARPVSVLQIHGTEDRTIWYRGGSIVGDDYPSVATTLATWRRFNGCGDRADTSARPIDLDSSIAGRETSITTYATGCRGGVRVELWSIEGGAHVPPLTAAFAPAVIDFLYARRAPTS
jgi:polyhydroxybutyrate depolymerase